MSDICKKSATFSNTHKQPLLITYKERHTCDVLITCCTMAFYFSDVEMLPSCDGGVNLSPVQKHGESHVLPVSSGGRLGCLLILLVAEYHICCSSSTLTNLFKWDRIAGKEASIS